MSRTEFTSKSKESKIRNYIYIALTKLSLIQWFKEIYIFLFQITPMNKCYHDGFLMVNLNLTGLKSSLRFFFIKHVFSLSLGGKTTQNCLKWTLTFFITKEKEQTNNNINSRLTTALWHGIIWIIQWHHVDGDFVSTWNNVSWDSTEPTDLSPKSLQHFPFEKKVPMRAGLIASRLYCMA